MSEQPESGVDERPVILLGAGGHAQGRLSALRRAGRAALFATGLPTPGARQRIDHLAIRPGADAEAMDPQGVELALGVGTIAPSPRRAEIVAHWQARGFRFATVIDPTALVCAPINLGAGCQILAGAIVQPGATIGAHCIVNTGARVDHDASLGAFVHLAPGVILSGNVHIGEGAHLGTGCSVVQGVSIGARALVAAGAVVIRDVDDDQRVAGVPARSMRGHGR